MNLNIYFLNFVNLIKMRTPIGLVKKQEKKRLTTFVIFVRCLSDINFLITELPLIKNFTSDLKYHHATSMGYWINVKVETYYFKTLIDDINTFCLNSEKYEVKDMLKEKTWASYWLNS